MISLTQVVWVVFSLIVAAAIFGLLWWAVSACAKLFVSDPGAAEPFIRVARFVLILGAVFVCIGFLLSLITGTQVFRP